MILKDPVKFYESAFTRVPFIVERDDGDARACINNIVVDTPEGKIHLKGMDAHYFACAVTQFHEYFSGWSPSDKKIKDFMTKLARMLNVPNYLRDPELQKDIWQFNIATNKADVSPYYKQRAEERATNEHLTNLDSNKQDMALGIPGARIITPDDPKYHDAELWEEVAKNGSAWRPY